VTEYRIGAAGFIPARFALLPSVSEHKHIVCLLLCTALLHSAVTLRSTVLPFSTVYSLLSNCTVFTYWYLVLVDAIAMRTKSTRKLKDTFVTTKFLFAWRVEGSWRCYRTSCTVSAALHSCPPSDAVTTTHHIPVLYSTI
jgi:hypothetical protein